MGKVFMINSLSKKLYIKSFIFLIVSFLFSVLNAVYGKNDFFEKSNEINVKRAFFSVKMEFDNNEKDSLRVSYWDTFFMSSQKQFFYVSKDPDQIYRFEIPMTQNLLRIKLYSDKFGIILNDQIIEYGDSIEIALNKNHEQNSVEFFGIGKEKYECSRNLKSIREGLDHIRYEPKNDLSTVFNIFEKRVGPQLKYLTKFQNQVSPDVYRTIWADIEGFELKKQISRAANIYGDLKDLEKKDYKHIIEKLFSFNNDSTYSIGIPNSSNYLDYLYFKSKINLTYERNRLYAGIDIANPTSYTFRNLYQELKETYSGIIREKLMVYYFLNKWEINVVFEGIDAEEYKFCVDDAATFIKTPSLRKEIEFERGTSSKGAKAYNFSLLNRKSDRINLSDFKGKVVLIDIWGDGCGGCIYFKRDFEKKVYPQLEKNPDFVFISINFNSQKQRWLEIMEKYSNPKFVNLYTKGIGLEHPLLKHYKVRALPFLLLVDRKGQVFSSTISIRKMEDLLSVIEEALEVQ